VTNPKPTPPKPTPADKKKPAPAPAPPPQAPTPPPPAPNTRGELPGMSLQAAAQVRPVLPGQYVPRAPVPSTHPRKVRGGIKLTSKAGPVSNAWATQRWMRLVEDLAAANAMAEGLAYARSGQTSDLSISPGTITANVQGRMPYPYQVHVTLPVLTAEQWDKVLSTMLDEARHLAGLLAGDVPPNVEDLFSPLRLRLFPQEQPDLTVSCTCGLCGPGGTAGPGWCKHVACVMAVVGERLGIDTFLMFQLRGMGREQLLDELRLRRAATGPKSSSIAGQAPATRPVPAYLPRLPGISDLPSTPLDQCLDTFWAAPGTLKDLDLSMQPPAVTHPLLRRLGPSPFDASTGARFPLVGLLATCYDLISEHTLRDAAGENI